MRIGPRALHSAADPLALGALALSVAAVSSSALLVTFAAVPALAIAFWRNLLPTALLGPVALARAAG